MNFKVTKNYLVINVRHLVICFNIQDIEEMNEQASSVYKNRI
jgi:hypothetical protein